MRTKPAPTRLVLISDALYLAGLGDLRADMGGLEVEVKDGRCTLVVGGSLAGAVVAVDTGVRNLVRSGVPLPRAVMAASTNPAALLRADDRGAIAAGLRADLVELSDDLAVRRVMRGGASGGLGGLSGEFPTGGRGFGRLAAGRHQVPPGGGGHLLPVPCMPRTTNGTSKPGRVLPPGSGELGAPDRDCLPRLVLGAQEVGTQGSIEAVAFPVVVRVEQEVGGRPAATLPAGHGAPRESRRGAGRPTPLPASSASLTAAAGTRP